jgi:acetyl-CoA acetyltransferase
VRNAIQDQIAIAGVGSTGFTREAVGRSNASLAYEAAVAAIRDAGLGSGEIDGVVASPGLGRVGIVSPSAREMVAGLGLPSVSYFADSGGVMASPIVDAMNAIFAGSCEIALIFHPNYRTPYHSKKAAADPFRRSIPPYGHEPVESVRNAAAYAAWMARYQHEHPSLTREHLGYVAINGRTGAAANPLAAIRDPLTMEDYLSARMIRDPLCMLDMDIPVDGADAFILTTTERARTLPQPPVLIHAAVQGIIGDNDEDQLPSLGRHGQNVVVEGLWARSDRTLADVDVVYLYDGFSFITISWIEKLGWAPPGEGGPFVERHFDEDRSRILIDGRIPVNTHGGSLSEGGSQGSGHVREAIHQLRGAAGERQVEGAETALVTIGGFFFNSGATILVRDSA